MATGLPSVDARLPVIVPLPCAFLKSPVPMITMMETPRQASVVPPPFARDNTVFVIHYTQELNFPPLTVNFGGARQVVPAVGVTPQ